MNGKVISVINWKGGVGKTTLTHHLGTGLMHLSDEERMRYLGSLDTPRVLLVDSDAQCSLSIACLEADGYQDIAFTKKMETLQDLYLPFLENEQIDKKVESCILKWHVRSSGKGTYPTVDLLPSHQELSFMDMNIAVYKRASLRGSLMDSDIYKFQVLKRMLGQVRDQYDFILIDCPPNLNYLTMNALYASDYYLIPTLLDMLSIYGISSIINRVNEMNELFGASDSGYQKTDLIGIVANNVREYNKEPKDTQMLILQRLYEMCGDQVFQNYVTYGDGIPQASQYGLPVYGLSGKAKRQVDEMLAVLTELLERIGR